MGGELTKFGQFTRTLRITQQEYLKDMALKLSITPAYLSAVEYGRRNVPFDWVDLLKKEYDLTDDSVEILTRAVLSSRCYDRLDISHLPFSQKIILGKLAMNIESIDRDHLLLLESWLDEV